MMMTSLDIIRSLVEARFTEDEGYWTKGATYNRKGQMIPGSKVDAQNVLSVEPKKIALKVGRNKQGEKVALVSGSTAVTHTGTKKPGFLPSHSVIVQKANYAGHVRGGIAHTWRVDKADLSREEAEKHFHKRAIVIDRVHPSA